MQQQEGRRRFVGEANECTTREPEMTDDDAPAPDAVVLDRYMDELLNHTDHDAYYRALITGRVRDRLARVRERDS